MQRKTTAILMAAMIVSAIGVTFLAMRNSATESLTHYKPCNNGLRQISLGLYNYHEQCGCFPPPYTVDADGRPLLSWRVYMLPFLDEVDLYRKFRLDEPWDSPHNRPLSDEVVSAFRCRNQFGSDEPLTDFVYIVGEESPWHGNSRFQINDPEDPARRRVLVIEISGSSTPWAKPADLPYETARKGVTPRNAALSGNHQMTAEHKPGVNVLLEDGQCLFFSHAENEQFLRFLRNYELYRESQTDSGDLHATPAGE